MPLASGSPTSTMSIDRLPNASSMSVDISLSWLQTVPGLMKPVERKVWFNDDISIFALSFSFLRKLAIHFSLFSSIIFCFPCLSSLYPRPNLSLFWITAIGLIMSCNLFPNPFPTQAPLPGTCFMLEWVISNNFGMGTFAHSPTYMAFTNFKNLKEHCIVFSSVSTYIVPDEVAIIISSSVAILTSYPSVTNLIF